MGEQRDLGPVAELQLGQDVRDVRLDRGHAHVELRRDLGVGAAPGDGEDDLTLARAQGAQREAGAFLGTGLRGGAVRSARLLDASAHPDITFISRRLGQADGRWALHGLLSVRGNAHPVELLIEEAQPAGQDLHVRASAGIDRYDFGITKVKGLAARHLGSRLDIVAHRL